MSPDQRWISTMSVKRFYDHCYLIECAYHIISKYCCSFINLLNHDDGSIPYYLVQKVKIAVEYGKMLLCTRYRPFQQHLHLLGTYDYIDHLQYESLCLCWNTIKTETQIVEMYFNQISLLIYPVVSSSTLQSLNSVEYSNVPALTKINTLIQNLIGCDEAVVCSSLLKNTHNFLKSDSASACYSEEELGLFIINRIIEPLFDEVEEGVDHNLAKIEYTAKEAKDLISYEDKSNVMSQNQPNSDFQSCSLNLVDFVFHRHGTREDIFRIDNKLLDELLTTNSNESPVCTMDLFDSSKHGLRKQHDKQDLSKCFDRGDNYPRGRHDNYQKRSSFQRKFQKRIANPGRKCTNDNSEVINKKYAHQTSVSKHFDLLRLK